MNLDLMYSKISTLISLEILTDKETFETVENEFVNEFLFLNNLTLPLFKSLTADEQFNVLRLLDTFYRVGKPLVEDKVYDTFDNYYKQNNNDNTPIMFEPSLQAWKKEEHKIIMGSLSKCNTFEEIEKWNSKPEIINAPKLISEKLDGISLECIYENGIFKKAITRGNGKVGENITPNAIYFEGVVKELSEKMDCSIRGEVIIKKENLKIINNILIEKGKEPLKNTRNGVAGQATIFKDRDEKILSLLTFIAYEIQVFNIKKTYENVV